MIINKCIYNGKDIGCGDGVCPDCNWHQHQLWMEAHTHCGEASWGCPEDTFVWYHQDNNNFKKLIIDPRKWDYK
ncbi:hypothetical protein 2016DhaA_0110 [Vibrio phage ICP1]|jgi:hypothetical protein|uniref:Uncharacterized protein ORF27 n=1 Tax=Vibrio phage ICP1 TaxID=979525 RepID=F1D149_9CAUD|nr:hypothetical protein ViPhICP1_gp027 [Vibrio phage ICP1]ADX88070.1 hypothetical protein TUST1-191_00120 [Vibrio phage ICP1_2006_D]ADX88297.1 hypothetical protein TUST1-182_00120 [Vibrio phage ICP1_2006_C]ADX88524.1 hypothetical protein TUST1-159_00120 [Vibrio phage ICP1_2006_B]ADX88750.1 hypothetical protein TUST1-17_00120 [Vibrio phage ICP1_2006_A]ADX88976.1 hypothetical protein TUST1-15_00120 [Vibrio phage ICP1_2005_A]ADX89208.1 hypothetical protein TUST1-2_00130 [Vibrio phage ICP1_2001_A